MDEIGPANAHHPFERRISSQFHACRKNGCRTNANPKQARRILHNVFYDCDARPQAGGQGLYDPMAVDNFATSISNEAITVCYFGKKLSYKAKGNRDVQEKNKRLVIRFASWEQIFVNPAKYVNPSGSDPGPDMLEVLRTIGAPLYVKEVDFPEDAAPGRTVEQDNCRGLWAAKRILKSTGLFKKMEDILAVHAAEPGCIDKIVCFDMGKLGATPDFEQWLCDQPEWVVFLQLVDVYTKHAVAILISEYLGERCNKMQASIDVFAQDESYTESNKEALAEFGIRVTDSPDAHLLVDRKTLVIAPPAESLINKEVICDMAQPFMMIWPTEKAEAQVPTVRFRMTQYTNIHTFNTRLEETKNDLAGWMQLCSWYRRKDGTHMETKQHPHVAVPRLVSNSRHSAQCDASDCLCKKADVVPWKTPGRRQGAEHQEALKRRIIHKVYEDSQPYLGRAYPLKDLKGLYGKVRRASGRFIYHKGYYFHGPRDFQSLGSKIEPVWLVYPWTELGHIGTNRPLHASFYPEVAEAFLTSGLPVLISWKPQQPPNGEVGVKRQQDIDELNKSIAKWKRHPRLKRLLSEICKDRPAKMVAVGLGDMDIQLSHGSPALYTQVEDDISPPTQTTEGDGDVPADWDGVVNSILDGAYVGDEPGGGKSSPADNHHMYALLILLMGEMRSTFGKEFHCYAQQRNMSESTMAILRSHGIEIATFPEAYLLADRNTLVVSRCYPSAMPVFLGLTRPCWMLCDGLEDAGSSRRARQDYQAVNFGFRDEGVEDKAFLFETFSRMRLYRRRS
ncbi:hypothetical protein MKZ38_009567 [Zalerion maritima]|uniref:SRR1-like domain-containing protein n=1 Tax=Zalerion maritima TaxID=339359 RepID=A0AAD5WVM4_9PEZI|nr:hypothetical protein MKZ38_009567 [Zalerion maritima]